MPIAVISLKNIMNAIKIDTKTGKLENYTKRIVRKLSDMKEFYFNKSVVDEILSKNDPVIYEVYAFETGDSVGNLSFATTILYPGKIGNEFFMTKGHFHEKRDRAEIYLGLSGSGLMLIMDDRGNAYHVKIKPHSVIYVPPNHAHRAVNTGKEKLIFLAIYPSDAGHDYGTILEKGFSKLVIEENNSVRIIDNPKFKNQ